MYVYEPNFAVYNILQGKVVTTILSELYSVNHLNCQLLSVCA